MPDPQTEQGAVSEQSQAYREHLRRSGRYVPLGQHRHRSGGFRPLLRIRKRLQAMTTCLQGLASVKTLVLLGNIGIVIAAGSFVAQQDVRHDRDVFSAWQTIASAAGRSGSGGRREAIEFLASRPLRFPWFCRSEGDYPECIILQQPQSLRGLNVALDYPLGHEADRALLGSGADLVGLQVPYGTKLYGADLQQAVLQNASLQGARLWDANLQQASLENADLQWASLWDANLGRAILIGANLQDASLRGANLQQAFLVEANLQDAFLMRANLEGALLRRANLQDAGLSGVRYTTADTPPETCIEIDRVFLPTSSDAELSQDSDDTRGYPCPTLWEDAVYNDNTALPDGLDPAEVGMRHIDDLSAAELQAYPWAQ